MTQRGSSDSFAAGSREEFAQATGIPGPLLAKALAPEQVGDLTAVQEAKIRAALAVIAGEIRSAADRVGNRCTARRRDTGGLPSNS